MIIRTRKILKILTTTRSLYSVLTMRFLRKRKSVTFWNGSTFQLDWSQFCILQDNYALLREYVFEQLDDYSFRIKSDNFEWAGNMYEACSIGRLKQKYSVEQLDEDVFKIKSEKFELIGSSSMLFFVWEIERGIYDCDCQGKVVLDVGGFDGESAVFFSLMGAQKVIIYEPVEDHHVFIRKNVSLNNVNAVIHEEGIGNNDGIKTINYARALGHLSTGSEETKIKIRDVAYVIKESGASVAKFDCEGAEESLIRVSRETLRLIELYIIEVHTEEIRKALIEKFKDSGFELEKDSGEAKLSVIFLRRK